MAGLEEFSLRQVDASMRDALRREHLSELERLADTRGVWVDVPALFAFEW